MPTWLSDPSGTFYVLLLVIVLIAIGVWFRNRDKRSRIAALVGVAVFALILLCDLLVQSPREEAVQRVMEMSKALNERNAEALKSHVSESFDYHGKKKADTKQLVDLAKQHNARTAVFDFDRERVVYVSETEIEIVFNGKADMTGGYFEAHFKTRFVRDLDGKWRLKTFTPYDRVRQESAPSIELPGF